MIHLKSISIKQGHKENEHYPFNLPLIQQFEELPFDPPMVIFVGENGSGKSTILEAVIRVIGEEIK